MEPFEPLVDLPLIRFDQDYDKMKICIQVPVDLEIPCFFSVNIINSTEREPLVSYESIKVCTLRERVVSEQRRYNESSKVHRFEIVGAATRSISRSFVESQRHARALCLRSTESRSDTVGEGAYFAK